MRRIASLAVVGALTLLSVATACHDGLLHPAAPRAASLDMRLALDRSASGATQAFDRADSLFMRFSVGNDVRLEQTVPFTSSGAATTVRVDVPMRELTEDMSVALELRAAGRALFRGTGNATFSVGAESPLDLELEPVTSSVTCGGSPLQFATYGRTASLQAAALFATGDTIVGAPISWSASGNGVVSVSSTGVVTALSDGDVDVSCRSAGVEGTREVKVFAVVNAIAVSPPTAVLAVGDTLPLNAVLRDSGNSVITPPRTVAWSTSNAAAATVSGAGIVTGTAVGSTRIDATAGGITGSASITVAPPPTVVTGQATAVGATSALLNGTVDARGAAAQAFFRFDTLASLATSTQTPVQSVAGGSGAVALSAIVQNLLPQKTYFYEIVATGAGGTTQGRVVAFTTGGSAPSLLRPSGFLECTFPNDFCVLDAQLTTLVGAGGLPTRVWFEYGSDTSFAGGFSTTPSVDAGSGTALVTIGVTVNGVSQPFFYRAVAQNALGLVRSGIQQAFTP